MAFGSGAVVNVGTIQAFGGSTAPDGWLICDGSAISRTLYADLFAVIGETYGAGDGSTTFNLPSGKIPLGNSARCLGDGNGLGLTDGTYSGYMRNSGSSQHYIIGDKKTLGENATAIGTYALTIGVVVDSEDSGIITDLTTASAASTAIIKY